MIPYSGAKRSDLYTLSKSKLLENHTLHSGTYLYSPYMAVPPPPQGLSLTVILGDFILGDEKCVGDRPCHGFRRHLDE